MCCEAQPQAIPTPAPAPTPATPLAPTAPGDVCASETLGYDACVNATGNFANCRQCEDSYYDSVTIGSCEESGAATCGTEAACPECGNCQNENVALTNCLNEGACEAITCSPSSSSAAPGTTSPPGSSSPQPAASPGSESACASEYTQYYTCAGATADYEGCLQCQDAYIVTEDVDFASCDESAAATCGIYAACPGCVACQMEEVALVNCLYEGRCETLDCSSSSGNTSPAPASAGPSNSTSSPAAPNAGPTSGGDGGEDPTTPTSAPAGNGGGMSSAARHGASMLVAAAAGTIVAAAIGQL